MFLIRFDYIISSPMSTNDSLLPAAGAPAAATSLTSTTNATSTGGRSNRFVMDGVGARVIRGPDWKWGKQVREKTRNLNYLFQNSSSSFIGTNNDE